MITAATADEHTIKSFDASTGQYTGSLYVTSGTIIGQPQVSSDTIAVTFTEGGETWLGIYDHNLQFKNKILMS